MAVAIRIRLGRIRRSTVLAVSNLVAVLIERVLRTVYLITVVDTVIIGISLIRIGTKLLLLIVGQTVVIGVLLAIARLAALVTWLVLSLNQIGDIVAVPVGDTGVAKAVFVLVFNLALRNLRLLSVGLAVLVAVLVAIIGTVAIGVRVQRIKAGFLLIIVGHTVAISVRVLRVDDAILVLITLRTILIILIDDIRDTVAILIGGLVLIRVGLILVRLAVTIGVLVTILSAVTIGVLLIRISTSGLLIRVIDTITIDVRINSIRLTVTISVVGQRTISDVSLAVLRILIGNTGITKAVAVLVFNLALRNLGLILVLLTVTIGVLVTILGAVTISIRVQRIKTGFLLIIIGHTVAISIRVLSIDDAIAVLITLRTILIITVNDVRDAITILIGDLVLIRVGLVLVRLAVTIGVLVTIIGAVTIGIRVIRIGASSLLIRVIDTITIDVRILRIRDTVTISVRIRNHALGDSQVEGVGVSSLTILSRDLDIFPGLQLSICRNSANNGLLSVIVLQEVRQILYRDLSTLRSLNRDVNLFIPLNLLIRDSVHVDVSTRNLRLSFRLFNGDSNVNVILRTIRVSHLNRNSNLVTRLSTLRNRNSNLTGRLINLHTLRRILTRSELRTLRSLGVLAVLVLKGRSRNLHILARLTRTILVTRLKLFVVLLGRSRLLDGHLGLDGLAGTIRVSYHDWDGVVASLRTLRRLDLDRSVRVNRDPLRLIGLVALWVSHLTGRLEGGSLRNLLAALVLRSFHGGLLTGRSSSVLILRLKFAVLTNLVHRNEGVPSDDYAVCVHELRSVRPRVLEIFRSQRALVSISQGAHWAVLTNLLAVRANPTDLVIPRKRQCARQLDLRRIKVVDAFRKVSRVEVGVVVNDVQVSDVGLNLSEVDVVPTLVGVAGNTNGAAPVRILTRVSVHLLENRSRETTEGVQDLAVLLCPQVGVVLHAFANILTHADRVAAVRIGNSTDSLEDRLLAVHTHVFDHGLGGSSLLAVRLIGDC